MIILITTIYWNRMNNKASLKAHFLHILIAVHIHPGRVILTTTAFCFSF